MSVTGCVECGIEYPCKILLMSALRLVSKSKSGCRRVGLLLLGWIIGSER